jgi:hypothetical protein
MPPATAQEPLLHHDELREAHGVQAIETMPTPAKRGGMGALVGAAIIVLLTAFGGLYFWGASLNAEAQQATLPLIPGEPAQ